LPLIYGVEASRCLENTASIFNNESKWIKLRKSWARTVVSIWIWIL